MDSFVTLETEILSLPDVTLPIGMSSLPEEVDEMSLCTPESDAIPVDSEHMSEYSGTMKGGYCTFFDFSDQMSRRREEPNAGAIQMELVRPSLFFLFIFLLRLFLPDLEKISRQAKTMLILVIYDYTMALLISRSTLRLYEYRGITGGSYVRLSNWWIVDWHRRQRWSIGFSDGFSRPFDRHKLPAVDVAPVSQSPIHPVYPQPRTSNIESIAPTIISYPIQIRQSYPIHAGRVINPVVVAL
ncbi:hypothetical protein K435DRAFT_843898 [Dendrothele bispora CBS 962.96]|uniref:Uncharacterized protein n=1 Tax=Dendrothele bispora (strain CBS 962.96) TaxID=1314807 RepID=A0A4S8L5W1_DENBC|nr:hypothetical protein K435DRAFT_843898 [Dendrothele bispora CBS 962.96]